MAKCDAKALGFAAGLLWGGLIFLTGLTTMWWNWGGKFLEIFANIYPGYAATYPGSLIGGLWGFIDGGVGGFLLGWLYNKFTR